MDATFFLHCRGTNDRFCKIETVRFEKNIDFDMLRLCTVDQIILGDKKMVLLKSDKVAKYA